MPSLSPTAARWRRFNRRDSSYHARGLNSGKEHLVQSPSRPLTPDANFGFSYNNAVSASLASTAGGRDDKQIGRSYDRDDKFPSPRIYLATTSSGSTRSRQVRANREIIMRMHS